VISEEALIGDLEEHAIDFHEIVIGVFDRFEFFVGEFVFDAFFAVLGFEDLADAFFNLLGHHILELASMICDGDIIIMFWRGIYL
jgi:hypothetical protein